MVEAYWRNRYKSSLCTYSTYELTVVEHANQERRQIYALAISGNTRFLALIYTAPWGDKWGFYDAYRNVDSRVGSYGMEGGDEGNC